MKASLTMALNYSNIAEIVSEIYLHPDEMEEILTKTLPRVAVPQTEDKCLLKANGNMQVFGEWAEEGVIFNACQPEDGAIVLWQPVEKAIEQKPPNLSAHIRPDMSHQVIVREREKFEDFQPVRFSWANSVKQTLHELAAPCVVPMRSAEEAVKRTHWRTAGNPFIDNGEYDVKLPSGLFLCLLERLKITEEDYVCVGLLQPQQVEQKFALVS